MPSRCGCFAVLDVIKSFLDFFHCVCFALLEEHKQKLSLGGEQLCCEAPDPFQQFL